MWRQDSRWHGSFCTEAFSAACLNNPRAGAVKTRHITWLIKLCKWGHIIQCKIMNLGYNNWLSHRVNIACIDLQLGAKVLAHCGFTLGGKKDKCKIYFIIYLQINIIPKSKKWWVLLQQDNNPKHNAKPTGRYFCLKTLLFSPDLIWVILNTLNNIYSKSALERGRGRGRGVRCTNF